MIDQGLSASTLANLSRLPSHSCQESQAIRAFPPIRPLIADQPAGLDALARGLPDPAGARLDAIPSRLKIWPGPTPLRAWPRAVCHPHPPKSAACHPWRGIPRGFLSHFSNALPKFGPKLSTSTGGRGEVAP